MFVLLRETAYGVPSGDGGSVVWSAVVGWVVVWVVVVVVVAVVVGEGVVEGEGVELGGRGIVIEQTELHFRVELVIRYHSTTSQREQIARDNLSILTHITL